MSEKKVRTAVISEPEAPQGDPAADAAREQVTERPAATAIITTARKPVLRFGAQANIVLRHAPGLKTINWHDAETRVIADLFPSYTGTGVQVILTARDGDGNPTGQATGQGLTARAAYTAAWHNLRLAKHDKADLLRQNAELRAAFGAISSLRAIIEADMKFIALDLHQQLEAITARDKRRRALLTARQARHEMFRLRVQNAQITSDTAAAVMARETTGETELRAGIDLIRQALADAGQTDGSLVDRVHALAADRDRWKTRADVSAASYRNLAKQLPRELQEQTAFVEVVTGGLSC